VSGAVPLTELTSWALMVTVPTFTPVARPFRAVVLEIVATDVFEDDQVRLEDLVRSVVTPSE